jgi:transmembrane 9 superfamily member 2/4
MKPFTLSSCSAALASLLLLAPSPSSAFYLPGVAPTSYKTGDVVPLFVNHLSPADSEADRKVRSVFSYDYYHPEFHFCQPEGGPKSISESLGSILFGDRILTSPFVLHMGQDEECKALCKAQTFTAEDSQFVNSRIWLGYNLNWLIDGLPAAQQLIDPESNDTFYSPGFALGYIRHDEVRNLEMPILNNHYNILVDYHQASKDNFRVVGVLVEPVSMAGGRWTGPDKGECGSLDAPVVLSENSNTEVTFTYSVYWRSSTTPFATRWDKYLHVYDPKIHWLSLVNSSVIVLFLLGMVSTVLVRALRKDIARYNRLDQLALDDLSGTSAVEDGVQEDSGWKLVHGDVFRPPRYPLPLSIMIGNGVQLFMMTGFTIGKPLLILKLHAC